MSRGKFPLLPVSIVIAAAAWRFAFLLEIRSFPLFRHPMVDARVYSDLAKRIAAGDGYPFAVFATNPFYPYFLGLFYKLFGEATLPVVIFQMLLGLGSLVLIYKIAKRLGGPTAGTAALLIGAFYRPLLFFEVFLLPTTAGIFVNLALVELLFRWEERRSSPLLFGAGLLLGVGTLVQGNLILLLPLLLAGLFLDRRRTRRASGAALLAVGFLLPILPVTARNWIRGEDFVLVSSHGGVNFYMGNNEKARGVFSFPEGILLTPENINVYESKRIAEKEAGMRLKPSEVSRYWMRRGAEWIAGHPVDWLVLLARKTALFWNDYEIPDNADLYFYQESNRALRWLPFIFGLIAPLGVVGMIVLWRKRKGGVLFLFLAAQFLSTLLFYTHSRYRMPFAALLIPVCAVGVTALAAGFRSWGLSRRLWSVAGVGLLFVLANEASPGGERRASRGFSLTHLANSLYDIGEVREAEKTYRSALEFLPDHATALYGLARLYQGEGRYDEAEKYSRKALRIIPTFAEAYVTLGIALRGRMEDEKALPEFREAIRLRPDWAIAHYNLGNCLYDLDRFGEAVEEYRKACELDPRNILFVRNLSNALEADGKLAEAEKAVRNGLARIGENADLRNRLGGILEEEGLVDEALAEYNRALSLDPRHSAALCNIGLVQYHGGDLHGAIATWKRILAYDPANPVIQNIRMAERALSRAEGERPE